MISRASADVIRVMSVGLSCEPATARGSDFGGGRGGTAAAGVDAVVCVHGTIIEHLQQMSSTHTPSCVSTTCFILNIVNTVINRCG